MLRDEILQAAREELAREVTAVAAPSMPSPFPVSSWVAMSALQKAIRRGRKPLALRAALTLLRSDAKLFWRRCTVTAFEDIGVADASTVSIASAAMGAAALRRKLGGDWSVGSYLVQRMCSAPKCRAADDLLLTAQRHPSASWARHEMATLELRQLLEQSVSGTELPIRALALWYAAGTAGRTPRELQPRRGDLVAACERLLDAGVPMTLVETARHGYRSTGEILCLFVPLLWLDARRAAPFIDDEKVPECCVRGVPGWAYDVYSREGQRGLQGFLSSGCESARWISETIPWRSRVRFLGDLLFRVEGQLVRRRLSWAPALELKRLVDVECHGHRCPNATELLILLRRDLHILNEVRRHVF